MKAKLKLNQVVRSEGYETLKFSAVTNGKPEDNLYSKYTPVANLEMVISNPKLIGKFNPGENYFLLFEKEGLDTETNQ